MWEAIRSNRRRSLVLIGLMGALLVALGFAIGMVVDPEVGGFIGAGAALLIWLIMLMVALFGADSVLLAGSGARRIEKDDAPRLWNIVEEMTIASGMGAPPKVYIIDDDRPNAFAAGRSPKTATVAVTSGLLKRLNRDELQGVVAHEIGHIHNQDIRFMTIAAVMLGSIALLSDVFLRSLWYGGGRRRGGRGGKEQAIFLVVAIVLAIVAPICAQMLYFACSRRREFLADASAARFTRYPEGLASALQKIAARTGGKDRKVNRALAPLYIVNPLQSRSLTGWFNTHPPTEQRIKILRTMTGGAAYGDYQKAYEAVLKAKVTGLPQRLTASDEAVPIRPPTEDRTGAAH